MKHWRWLAALAALLLSVSQLYAQLFFLSSGPTGLGNIAMGRALGFGSDGRYLFYSAYLSSPYNLGGFYPFSSFWSGPFGRSTLLLYGTSQPVVVSRPIVLVQAQGGRDEEDLAVIRPRPEMLARREEWAKKGIFVPEGEGAKPELPGEPEPAPLRGKLASVFRKIGPEERARAQKPVPPEPPKPPEQPGPADLPAVKPNDDFAQRIALGKESLATRQYGLAARRLRQASQLDPAVPMVQFLLAQAEFALGKYKEAVEAIHVGLHLRPDWPLARFRPAELYQDNAADFTQQLKQLQDVVQQFPQDPVPLFLLGYELWFAGQHDEAVRFFQRARIAAPDKHFMDLFLKAKPPNPIAQK